MSFRQLLSPILRRFGASGSARNTQAVTTGKTSFQNKNTHLRSKRAIDTSTSLTSFDRVQADELRTANTRMPTTDFSTQENENISLCEREHNTAESTNIRRCSSCNNITGNCIHATKNRNSITNNNRMAMTNKKSKSTDEIFEPTSKQSSENIKNLLGNDNDTIIKPTVSKNSASFTNTSPDQPGTKHHFIHFCTNEHKGISP